MVELEAASLPPLLYDRVYACLSAVFAALVYILARHTPILRILSP